MTIAQDSSHVTGVASTRDGRTNKEPSDATAHRARERKAAAALELALAGATWDEIAEALGYPTARAARVAVELTLERRLNNREDREALRQLAGARLERLLRAVWPKAIDPHHPEQLTAVTKSRDLIDRFIRLHGLDAPTEVVVHNPTQAEIDAWVARVVQSTRPSVPEYDIITGQVITPEIESGDD